MTHRDSTSAFFACIYVLASSLPSTTTPNLQLFKLISIYLSLSSARTHLSWKMRQSFRTKAIVLFILFIISSSTISARILQNKEGYQLCLTIFFSQVLLNYTDELNLGIYFRTTGGKAQRNHWWGFTCRVGRQRLNECMLKFFLAFYLYIHFISTISHQVKTIYIYILDWFPFGILLQLMGLEVCVDGDEDCLKRRVIAEAHLDYIYTQHHKPWCWSS